MKPIPVTHVAPARTTEIPTRRTVTPVLHGSSGRTVGVVVEDRDGAHWKATPDIEGLVRLGIVAAAAVALPVGLATVARRPTTRVDRLSMGPGGWVSFKGFAVPRGRAERRPWWARLLRAHRAN
jgi:hypothetical protein